MFLPPGGKARALNAGVAAARHEVLIFTDARQAFADDALRALVAPLADPQVGGVSGELLLDSESGAGDSTIGEGVGAYWRYEKWLRRHESLIGSIVGSTGAIHALRRSSWLALPDDTILDDVLAPMRTVLSGARVIFEGSARAYDRTATTADAEFRRKTRTLAGNYQLLMLEPRVLLPVINPVWFQFVSHKLGRLIVPYALIALLVSSAALALDSWFLLWRASDSSPFMVSPAMARFSSGRHEALSVRLLDDIHGSAPGARGIHLRDAEHGRGQRSHRDRFRQTSLAVGNG